MNETPYLRRRGDRWFFILGEDRARRAGWFWTAKDGAGPRLIGRPKGSIPLGLAQSKADVAAVREEAAKLYNLYLTDSGLAPAAAPADLIAGYPPDSLGAWFRTWTTAGFEDWKIKSARAREDYARTWPAIDAAMGRRPIHKIAPNEFAAHQRQWEKDLSPSERFRTVKCARAIFTAAETHKIIAKGASPATILPNAMPAGRRTYVVAKRVEQWAAEAMRQKKTGLALLIRTAWAGAQAPVDIRTLTISMLHRNDDGAWFHRERTKTRAELYIALPADLAADIDAYVAALEAKLKVKLSANAPIFRKRHGTHYRERRELSQDFARVRAKVDAEDKAQLQDLRRSANLEMRLGGASAEERAKILANTLHKSRFLEATYTPPTLALARKMSEKREAGRALLASPANESGNAPAGRVERVETGGEGER